MARARAQKEHPLQGVFHRARGVHMLACEHGERGPLQGLLSTQSMLPLIPASNLFGVGASKLWDAHEPLSGTARACQDLAKAADEQTD